MAKEKTSKWHTLPWNKDVYLEEMLLDKKIAMRIVAMFAKHKDAKIDSLEQMQFFIKRHTKSAASLSIFPIDQIEKTLLYLLEKANYKVTLETVEKYITEDIEVLEGKTPAIILNNGEKIYDVKRIKELERLGIIYYDGKKWLQREV